MKLALFRGKMGQIYRRFNDEKIGLRDETDVPYGIKNRTQITLGASCYDQLNQTTCLLKNRDCLFMRDVRV